MTLRMRFRAHARLRAMRSNFGELSHSSLGAFCLKQATAAGWSCDWECGCAACIAVLDFQCVSGWWLVSSHLNNTSH